MVDKDKPDQNADYLEKVEALKKLPRATGTKARSGAMSIFTATPEELAASYLRHQEEKPR